jgi:hypothetical protein
MLELARMDEFGEVKVKNHPGFFFYRMQDMGNS